MLLLENPGLRSRENRPDLIAQMTEMDKTSGGSRARKMCDKCKQMLSYSAYNRHLSPLVCSASSATSACTSVTPHEVEIPVDERESNEHDVHSDESSASIDSASYGEPSDEEEVEIIDENEVCGYDSMIRSDSDVNKPEGVSEDSTNPTKPEEVQPNTSAIIQYICYIVSFFQLCYKLSDRAVTLLLFSYVDFCFATEGSHTVKRIIDNLPRNVYFLKKYLRSTNQSIRYYVVCPKCCTLFQRQRFPTYRTLPLDIPKCIGKSSSQCNAFLYKKVKHGSHYKVVPKLLYSYFPIKESLAKLYNRQDFHKNCEAWRKRRVVEGVYTDIYDGTVWKDVYVLMENSFYLNLLISP